MAGTSIIGWVGDKSNTAIDFYVSATQNDLCLGDDSDSCVMKFDAGKVSIGDSTPDARFDVDGGNVSFDNGQFFFDSDANMLGMGNADPNSTIHVKGGNITTTDTVIGNLSMGESNNFTWTWNGTCGIGENTNSGTYIAIC